jgi:hypothetical protein
MRFQLRLILLDSKVICIAGWRWLGERINRRVVNFCINVVRWILIAYLSLFFYGFYSFGWFF